MKEKTLVTFKSSGRTRSKLPPERFGLTRPRGGRLGPAIVAVALASWFALSQSGSAMARQESTPAPPSASGDREVDADGVTKGGTKAVAKRTITLTRAIGAKCALRDGSTLAGSVANWTLDDFEITVDGEARRVAWDDLAAVDVFRLRKRLVELLPEEERKPGFLALVTYLASRDDADEFVSRAFDEAKRWKATDEERVQAIAASEARRQERNANAARLERARLGTGSPEAAPFSSVAWPKQTAEERTAADAALRKRATEIISASGRDITPIDGSQVLVYSAVGLADGARRATEIEQFIKAALVKLGLPRETNIWQSKLAVLVSEDRDRFTLIEASGFRQEARPEDRALAHYDGGMVFVHIAQGGDETTLALETYRAVALALLHRHISAARLPAWCHEGFADWLVASYRPTKQLDKVLRDAGLAQVRGPQAFRAAVQATYRPREWPFPDLATRGAAYVLTSYLVEKHGDAFRACLEAVKKGEPWNASFERTFKAPFARVVDAAWSYHKVND
jgi:hypothetical protein